ncbi:hypothetical protein GCM10010430_06690 [Kitasatospora cystarginea]|uniref:Uncharacterized protein n=1 Tax=Kitasatospora cystarginea TaxID=58350 RepID=A0ABN3DF17_9ACTN
MLSVVTVGTPTEPRRVLKFTARSVDIGDLDLAIDEDGSARHLRAGPGSTSTLAGGSVTLYAESLSGRITGLDDGPLPADRSAVVTPDAVPQWLYGPDPSAPHSPERTLTFEDVAVRQARLLGPDLAVPGMRLNEDRA